MRNRAATKVSTDGGRMTSDSGVLVLAEIERKIGLTDQLDGCLKEPYKQSLARFAIPCQMSYGFQSRPHPRGIRNCLNRLCA